MIIFASTKQKVDDIHRALTRQKVDCKAIHSDKEQIERNEILRNFKAKNFRVLVATDILSRGIDIDGLSHVLNYDVPDDPADYVHRVGRTARADNKGIAITFINDTKDQFYFFNIEELIEKEIEKFTIPSSLGESPTYEPKKFLRSKGKKKNFKRKKQWNKNKKSRK